jgi:mono/diheme cytochrome c family protein
VPAIPSGNLRGDATAGARIYGQFCATCHGVGGKGDGPMSQLEPKPADHTDRAYMGSLSDQHLYKVISQGGASVGKSPLMAPWGGVLTDPQIRDLIAQPRALPGT